MTPTRTGDLLKPAFLTTLVALAAFGASHAAFITWAVDRSQDASLALLLVQMFAAPVLIGIPFAIIAALANAATWRLTSGTPLRSWRYGAVLASALAAPVTLSLLHGPFGDDSPAPQDLVFGLGGMVVLPAIFGAWVARSPRGAMVALAAVPLALPWSFFLLGSGMVGWVVPFVVSLFMILVGGGWLMSRFEAASRVLVPLTPADAELFRLAPREP